MLTRDDSYYTVATFLAIIAIFTILLCLIAITQLLKKLRLHSNGLVKMDQILLTGLCVSDVLLGTSGIYHSVCMFLTTLPPEKLLYAANYISRFTLLSSLLHVVALTMERVLFVKFPFFHRSCCCCPRKAFIVGATIWISSVGLSVLQFTTLLKVLIPIIIICDVILISAYVYILKKMCLSLKRQASSRKMVQDKNVDKETFQKGRKATLVCLMVVASFIACTTPPLVWIIQHKHRFWGRFYIPQELEDYVMIIVLISKGAFDPMIYIFRRSIAKRVHWRKVSRTRQQTLTVREEADQML